jgi:hypothetical protein
MVNKNIRKEITYTFTFWYTVDKFAHQSVISVSYLRWPYFEFVDRHWLYKEMVFKVPQVLYRELFDWFLLLWKYVAYSMFQV